MKRTIPLAVMVATLFLAPGTHAQPAVKQPLSDQQIAEIIVAESRQSY